MRQSYNEDIHIAKFGPINGYSEILHKIEEFIRESNIEVISHSVSQGTYGIKGIPTHYGSLIYRMKKEDSNNEEIKYKKV